MRRLLLRGPGALVARLTATLVTALVTTLGAALVVLTLVAAPASAHGALVEGSPGPGDDVAIGTTSLRLGFTALDPDTVPLVAVLDPGGEPVAVGAASLADDQTICATSAPLGVGVHTIEYSVLSDDGDRQSGTYTFDVSETGVAVEPGDCAGLDLAAPGEARTLEQMGTGSLPIGVLYGLGALGVMAVGLLVLRVRADRRQHPADRGLRQD